MPKVKEAIAEYKVDRKSKSRSRPLVRRKEFVLDNEGKKVGVILDLPTYEQLLDWKEELEDIRDFDETTAQALAEYKRGEYVTLQKLKGQRKVRR